MTFKKTSSLIELPTWLAIFSVYFLWWFVLNNFFIIPLSPLFLVFILTFHGSVQHELIHGHPTNSQKINDLLACPALGLWSPYSVYKNSHLAHHEDANLTIPEVDPESYFISIEKWDTLSKLRQKFALFNMTLFGRLFLGPLWYFINLKKQLLVSFNKPFSKDFLIWFSHELMTIALLFIVWYIFGVHYLIYIACAYFAHSLTMLRSFYEHRPSSNPNHRSLIMKTILPLNILFLNNNYHFVHHKNPKMSWYSIPKEYKVNFEKYNHLNGNFIEKGYFKWFKNYLFKPVTKPKHPAF